jgi:hypothetical protein
MNFSASAHNKIYWKCIHVMCLCYSIEKDITNDHAKAMKGFLITFADLLPNKIWGKWMNEFINMTAQVSQDLTKIDSLKTFLTAHKPNSVEAYLLCKKGEVSLHEWSWMLHEYVNYKRQKDGENIKAMSLNEFKKNYCESKLSKDQWGRPLWFCIHTFALYLSSKITSEERNKYKAFISSMQFVLPCPICKQHIKENLVSLNFDDYTDTNMRLFEWTVILHNKVNSDNHKNVMSLRDALELYKTPDGSRGSEDGSLERIFL